MSINVKYYLASILPTWWADICPGSSNLFGEFDGCVAVVAGRCLTDGADRCAARRLRAVQSERLAVLAAHQRLEAVFDHGVEFAAFQLSSRHQVMVLRQLHLPTYISYAQ